MKSLVNNVHRDWPKGFALVVTLSLMILLTLLAVGLLSLSTIALRTSSQGSAMAIARSNARLAMMIALGQLQKTAGQDQRVTSPANLAGDKDGMQLAAGAPPANSKSITGIANGLTTVQPGTRYWTGVWDTMTTSTPASQIYTTPPSATNVRWLISGNEVGLSSADAFTPASPVAAVSPEGEISDPEQAALLVGRNSVGEPSSSTVESYVAAPTVDVEIEAAGVKSRGRYAWWVGDEGVKTRFNRAARGGQRVATDGDLASGRGGWEVVSGMQNYPVPDSPEHLTLERVATLPTGDLVNGLEMTGRTPEPLFHAATADSFGVLADSLQGGLRIDLTSSLGTGFPPAEATTFPNAARTGSNIIPSIAFPRSAKSELKGPTWDTLKAFYSTSKTVSTENKLTVKAATGSGYDITVAPIIVDVRAVLGVRMVSLGGTQCKLNPCVKIAVCIANPYSYPLEWDKDLELEFIDDTPRTNNTDTSIYGAGQTQRFLGRGSKSRDPDGSPMSGSYEPGVLNNAVFVISKGSLPPGEASAYTIGRGVTRPVNDAREVRVPLKAFGSSSPSNFENCLELDQPGGFDFASARQLDVRESWTTSQPTVELRLAGGRGSGTVLCRIERFEWDNAYHARTKTTVNYQAVRTLKMPIPLKVYTNQISLPGADYQNQLPARDMMGTRCSTLRTFADFNLRASKFGKLITSYNPPPYFFIQADDIVVDLPPTPASSSLPSNTGPSFTRDLALSPVPWGRSMTARDVEKTILFTFPKQFVSLAQLQHADLTGDDEAVSISQQPGNAFGNSYASPFVKRNSPVLARNNYFVTGRNTGVAGSSIKLPANYYDISYLLNAAVWDTYYFSSFDDYAGTGAEPLNRSMTVAFPPSDPAALQDPVRAAAHLLVSGSFNVNCTNKDAWKALLAGTRFLEHPAGGDPGDAMFPRSLEQTTASATPPSGIGADSFSGYRRLTPQQIDSVAAELVKQVRQRGPFVSLSHFVNRTLIDLSSRVPSAAMLGRSGALQAALDGGGANISPDGRDSAFGRKIATKDDQLSLQAEGNYPKADVLYPSGGGFPGNQPNGSRGSTYGGEELDGSPVWANTSADLNFGAVASIYADRAMLKDRNLQPEQGFRSTGIPGWVTQADVLQAIGPVLSARSDTFRIRGYGEALSPDGKTVLAKAWCEAIVQRTPNYIDPANTPTERDASLTDKVLTAINKQFGRRLEIVSFRWLSQDEI